MDTQLPRVGRLAGQLLSALLIGVLAACGSDGNGSGEDTPSPSPTTEAPTETTEPAPTQSEESPMPEETTPYLDPSFGSDEPGSGSALTITGTVESGVEAGCLILEHDGTIYGIYGNYDSSVVYSGATVTLHGHIEKDMMTTCQQGTPFVVEDAESAG